MKRWNIATVNEYVNNNSDCKLLSTEYINIDEKLLFECSCGNQFTTSFDKFKGRNKRQCNECSRRIMSEKRKLSYREVKQFIEVDSRSGCQLISKEYNSTQEKLIIKCKCGNEYQTKWNHFKNSNQRQCPECGTKMRLDSRRLPYEEVVATIEKYNCKLLSTYENYDSKLKLQCQCGNIFYTSYNMFKQLGYHSCHDCNANDKITSKGEDFIRTYLINNGIDFKEEYTFKDLKNSNVLRFDFAIFKNDKLKMIIEFDGKQHYGIGNFSDDTDKMLSQFQRVLESDFKKNTYCFENGIPILRIPYHKYNKIVEILDNSI